MRIRPLAASLLVITVLAATARAADDVQISEVAVRTLKPQTLLYREVETSLSEMGQTVVPIVEQLDKLVKDKKVVYAGSAIFVYQGATSDPARKFKLQVGFAVADGTAAQGDFKVRRLEPFKCATVLYGGALSSVAQAYEKVYGGVGQGGYKPTGESREYYLHWEGEDSPNNVELIAVGIQ
jgi:effector-binding domain-containing protein